MSCDIYKALAAEMFDIAYEDVTPEERKMAKIKWYSYAYSGPQLTGDNDGNQD